MSFFHSKMATAKLIGHDLVASFPAANPPLIWKFDLERNHSFTIALQGDEGDWELGITSPKGEFYPVAHFLTKEDAEDALNKVQKVLMKKRRSPFWRTMRWIIGLLLLAAFLFVGYDYYTVLKMGPTSTHVGSANGVMGAMPNLTPSAAPAEPAPAIKPGVPMSADDVLQPPR